MNKVNYLRIYVTDRCNLNCIYCNPEKKDRFLRKAEILSYEEMARIAGIFSLFGVDKIRITGGEPLIKKGITRFVAMLRELPLINEISMTTNGIHLARMAKDLKSVGLDRLNISLDTLRPDRFVKITGSDGFWEVYKGVMSSIESGLEPVKINVVLMNGINDDEVVDFVNLIFKYPLDVRFIEYFPVNIRLKEGLCRTLINKKVKAIIYNAFGSLEQKFDVRGSGPAEYFKLKGAIGNVGFISNFSNDFCSMCNRIRINSSGKIYPCLFSPDAHDVRHLIREDVSNKILMKFIADVIREKSNHNKRTELERKVEMSSVGG